MTLNELKKKRILESLGDRLLEKNAINESDSSPSGDGVGAQVINEGEKKHRTPEFVRHCVTAITEKPKSLDRVQQKKDGSPFAICHAQYKKDKRSLAAKHSKGEHHTNKEYEKALKTLRTKTEELRNQRAPRSSFVFEAASPNTIKHKSVRFETR